MATMRGSGSRASRELRSDRGERPQKTDAPPLGEPLGGFIFCCSNETMSEDLQRQLFGLPTHHANSVCNIKPGMPLFLYNYSTHLLHGVFEATSQGDVDIDPVAWDNKYPAQVRVKLQEERPPLPEVQFRRVLHHYDGPKFRLELSVSQTEELLEMFGATIARIEEGEEDGGGDWERVRAKNRTKVFKPPGAKRSSSPNSSAARRRSSGGSSEGGSEASKLRERGSARPDRADAAPRWRADSNLSGVSRWAVGDKATSSGKTVVGENGVGGDAHSDTGTPLSSASALTDDQGTEEGERASETSGQDTEENGGRDFQKGQGFVRDHPKSPVLANRYATRVGGISYSAMLRAGMQGGGSGPAAEAGDGAAGEVGEANGRGSGGPKSASSDVGSVAASVSGGSLSKSSSSSSLDGNRRHAGADDLDGGRKHAGSLEDGKQGSQDGAKEDGLHGGKKGRRDGGKKHAGVEVAEGSGRLGGDAVGSLEREAPAPGSGGAEEATDLQTGRATAWSQPSALSLVARGLAEAANGLPGVGPTECDDGLKPLTGNGKPSTSRDGGRGKEFVSRGAEPPVVDAQGVSGHTKPSKFRDTHRFPAWPSDAPSWRSGTNPPPGRGRSSDSQVTSSASSRGELPPRLRTPPPQKLQALPHVQPAAGSHVQMAHVPPYLLPLERLHTKSGAADLADTPLAAAPRGAHIRPQGGPKLSPRFSVPVRPQGVPLVQLRAAPMLKVGTHADAEHWRSADRLSPGHGMLPSYDSQAVVGRSGYVSAGPMLSPGAVEYQWNLHSPAGGRASLSPSAPAFVPGPSTLPPAQAASPSPVGMPLPRLVVAAAAVPAASSPGPARTLTAAPPPAELLANASEIHRETLEYARLCRPSQVARARAAAAVQCVREAVTRLWPGADVEVFGSFATGLCLPHSDVDVAVVDAPPPILDQDWRPLRESRHLVPLIRNLAASLTVHPWCEGSKTIETATMPVIKLKCRPELVRGEFGAGPREQGGSRSGDGVSQQGLARGGLTTIEGGGLPSGEGPFAPSKGEELPPEGVGLTHSAGGQILSGEERNDEQDKRGPNCKEGEGPGVEARGDLKEEAGGGSKGEGEGPEGEEGQGLTQTREEEGLLSDSHGPKESLGDGRVADGAEDAGADTARRDEAAALAPVAIDITIMTRRPAPSPQGPVNVATSHNGAAARQYVVDQLWRYPALGPLVLLLKSYLHHRNLNNVYTGGLGSFSLTLMVVFFLERVSPEMAKEMPQRMPSTTSASSSAPTSTAQAASGSTPSTHHDAGLQAGPAADASSKSCASNTEAPPHHHQQLLHEQQHDQQLEPSGDASAVPTPDVAAVPEPSGSGNDEVGCGSGGGGSAGSSSPPPVASDGDGAGDTALDGTSRDRAQGEGSRGEVGEAQEHSGVGGQEPGRRDRQQPDSRGVLGTGADAAGGTGTNAVDKAGARAAGLRDALPLDGCRGGEAKAEAERLGDGADDKQEEAGTSSRGAVVAGRGRWVVPGGGGSRRGIVGMTEPVDFWGAERLPNLGVLLVGFLNWFGRELDLSRVKLVPKGQDGSAGGVVPHERTVQPVALWIDDPLRPGVNVGAGSFAMWNVQAALRDMLAVVSRALSDTPSGSARPRHRATSQCGEVMQRLPLLRPLFTGSQFGTGNEFGMP